jgi:oligogalacturonide lyase
VFAGASRSKASSYILILLRVTRRELALCEHHASDPSLVSVVFAPDSRNIVFVSDRHGKPALYRVPVQRFVEETDDQ